jgi:hypothetical protein
MFASQFSIGSLRRSEAAFEHRVYPSSARAISNISLSRSGDFREKIEAHDLAASWVRIVEP